MQATTKYIEEFLAIVNQPEWATEERWPQVWTNDSEDPGFKFYLTAPDPYELLEDVVNLVKVSENEVFYIMTGWMTPVNDNGDTDDDPDSIGYRLRVRILLGAAPNVTPFIAVERAGQPVEIFENMGEGMFPETFNALMSDD